MFNCWLYSSLTFYSCFSPFPSVSIFFLLYIPVLKLTVSCPLLTRMSSINQLAIELLQLYYHVLGEELNKL